MSNQLQPWGGDVRLPGWLRRMLGRGDPVGDTPEAAHEKRRPTYPDVTPIENADRAIFGAWSEGHPGNKRR